MASLTAADGYIQILHTADVQDTDMTTKCISI